MVLLVKNQMVLFSKELFVLSQFYFGFGWDLVKKKGFFGGLFGGNDLIDFDVGCVLMDSIGKIIDIIWFCKLKFICGVVVYSGDNLIGEGDGDDEVIKVNFFCLFVNVEYLVFMVNSFCGQLFNDVENVFCCVVD